MSNIGTLNIFVRLMWELYFSFFFFFFPPPQNQNFDLKKGKEKKSEK